jgi:hypothetical protein
MAGLSQLISDGTEQAEVSFVEDRLEEVPIWQGDITLHVQISGVRDLAAFDMELEYSPRFEIAGAEFVKPGPLWDEFAAQFSGRARPLLVGVPVEDATGAFVFGLGPTVDEGSGISTEKGILAKITLRIVSPGSGFVRIKNFFWTKAGGDLIKRTALAVQTTTVQIIQQEKRVYLSFEPLKGATLVSGLEARRKRAKPGDVVQVSLVGESFLDVTGVRFDMSFDKEGLDLLSIEAGDLFRREGRTLGCFDPVVRANNTGKILDQGIALLGPSGGARGGGTVATLLFRVRGNLPADIRLDRVVAVRPGMTPREEEIKVQKPRVPLTLEIE